MEAEDYLKEAVFVVEATGFEQHAFWKLYVYQEKLVTDKDWVFVAGWILGVGKLDNRPINIGICFYRIRSKLVCFYEAVSELVDRKMIKAWFAERYNGRWDNGTRPAWTDADNFHHCMHHINELLAPKEKEQEREQK